MLLKSAPCRCRRRRSRRRMPCLCSSIPPQAASLATSLSMLNASTGGVTSAARRRVRSLGVPGLDLGFGCGVMLGYGWGAGLMLKPSALQSLTNTLQSAGRAIVQRLPQPVQAALAQRRAQQAASGSWGLPPAGAPAPGLGGGAAAGGLPLGLHDLTVQQQQQQGELWYVTLVLARLTGSSYLSCLACCRRCSVCLCALACGQHDLSNRLSSTPAR